MHYKASRIRVLSELSGLTVCTRTCEYSLQIIILDKWGQNYTD
jgi:hypothetical protein